MIHCYGTPRAIFHRAGRLNPGPCTHYVCIVLVSCILGPATKQLDITLSPRIWVNHLSTALTFKDLTSNYSKKNGALCVFLEIEK